MKEITQKLDLRFYLFVIIIFVQIGVAQVGINTTAPDASAALDVSSTNQGFLVPRMTTIQKNAILSPANALLVYDTDLKGYSYYDSFASTWVNMAQGRNKFKRIKGTDVLSSVLSTELAAGGGTKYLLDTQTYYEINGAVTLDLPIELNNAYVVGLDSGEDKLIKLTGDLFVGNTGGTIKVLTLVTLSGNVFNINGGGTQNIVFRDMIIANSANVGLLENFALIFSSVIQYAGNSNGIVYRNISKLLLDNQAWFGNSMGTFEKYEGTFNSILKDGGFLEVNGTAIGIDVTANPTINNNATIVGVNFTGIPTTGEYVKGYTVGSYSGFNFNNNWEINCSGIPFEGDSYTVGDVNFDLPVGSGFLTTLSTGTPTKILGATVANNFFRASTGGSNNRIQYLGHKKRFFTISGTISFQATSSSNTIYMFYIAKNGTVISRSKTYALTTNTTDIFAIPLQTVLELSPNDYVEVYAERYSGGSNILTVSLNLFMR